MKYSCTVTPKVKRRESHSYQARGEQEAGLGGRLLTTATTYAKRSLTIPSLPYLANDYWNSFLQCKASGLTL